MTQSVPMLSSQVTITGRFMRSARIDMDLTGTPPLEGYVLQASTERVLAAMARSKSETGQCAFTWTGPYGGGKSSTALLIGNLIAGAPNSQKLARKIAGRSLTSIFGNAFPKEVGPWRIIPVTGSRTNMREAIAVQASAVFGWSSKKLSKATLDDQALIRELSAEAKKSGVVLILDELGKFLEAATDRDHDAHLLQDIAEISARSDGRLTVIGILHQSFEAYADRTSASSRLDWAKIQGRFQDLSFLSAADETVRLLGRAIQAEQLPSAARAQAEKLALYVAERRPTDKADLTAALEQTWPLNPICSLLLGGITRRRFGQNERSVFGFLASAEPSGFSEYLDETPSANPSNYSPAHLWDYLDQNFGLALAAGSQSTQFSLALEAIDRASAKGNELHRDITKSAALIELFKNGSGLGVDLASLTIALPNVPKTKIKKALVDLCQWGVLLERTSSNAYALFTGSDFDIDAALDRFRGSADTIAFDALVSTSGQSPMVAKRHYFDTGVLRGFELIISRLDEELVITKLVRAAKEKAIGASGVLILLLRDKAKMTAAQKRQRATIEASLKTDGLVFATSCVADIWGLTADAVDLGALSRVESGIPQIAGDQIARRALRARTSNIRNRIIISVQQAVHSASWKANLKDQPALGKGIQSAASGLADAAFPSTPVVRSELLQKERPSSSAAAARRALMHAMVSARDKKDLGFKGYPASRGLYLTVITSLGLHADLGDRFGFQSPRDTLYSASLEPAWTVLTDADKIDLESVYSTWSKPPFGIKLGIMPILALAYILAERERVAVYQDAVFQTEIDDVFVDRMLQTPADVTLRKADRDQSQSALLSSLAKALLCKSDSALSVAKAVFKRVEDLPVYAQRTQSLSPEALRIRDTIRRSSDPEALLFDQLPALKLSGDLATAILNAISEAEEAYPKLLSELRAAIAHAVGVDETSFDGIAERAKSVINISSDLKFDAYAQRLATFQGGGGDVEAFASPLQDKPVRDWSDRNRDGAIFEIATFARQFKQSEAVASVLKRKTGTEAISLIVGINPSEAPLVQSFELSTQEQKAADTLAQTIVTQLSERADGQNIQLAVLARAVAALTKSTEAIS